MKTIIEKGFEIKTVDITEWLCKRLEITYQVDDQEKDEYNNILKFGSWYMTKDYPHLDNLIIEISGTFLLVNDQVMSAELQSYEISDAEGVEYQFSCSKVAEAVKCLIS
jgi:hypothetical protein